MEEVGGYLQGERDYLLLQGATGPLVYPAGFVYLYSILYKVTDEGRNILLAQYIFAALYLGFTAVVFAVYSKTKVPPYVMGLLCMSRRLHSIFVLRLFNDCFAMFFFYVALLAFLHHRWNIGSLFFTVAVSIKMNVLLYAPALLCLLLFHFGPLLSIPKLAICGGFQVLVGIPFLIGAWKSYLIRSFDFGRQFMYKWTVNWRFFPEDIFLSKSFSRTLLFAHIAIVAFFALKKWTRGNLVELIQNGAKKANKIKLTPDYIVLVMFSCNLIGITFARSLHYQFYVWYYHTLPFLLWQTRIPVVLRIITIALIEIAWNTYPSTNISSLILTLCHLFILFNLALVDFQGQDHQRKNKSK